MSAVRDDGIEIGRRVYERFAVEVAAQVTCGDRLLSAWTRDVSRGGTCFNILEPMETGAAFEISLALVLDENTVSEALNLNGRVIWCTKIAEGYQIGASFTQLTSQTREYLRMFLDFLAKGVNVGQEEEEEEDDDNDFEEKGLFG
jgi:hypothetical protein